MPLGDFAEAGTTPKPLPIGRTARFLAGLGASFYFVWNILQFSDRVGLEVPAGGYFVGVVFAWWYLSDAVVVGFGQRWGRWPRLAVLPIAAVLVIADLVAYESAWGPPLGWGVFVMTEFWFAFIGPSFILAALFAVPG